MEKRILIILLILFFILIVGILSKGRLSKPKIANEVANGFNQVVTSQVYIDVEGSTITIPTFAKERQVLLLGMANVYVQAQTDGNFGGRLEIGFQIDNNDPIYNHDIIRFEGGNNKATAETDGIRITTQNMFRIVTLSEGSHTIRLRARVIQTLGNSQATINNFKVGYFIVEK